MGMSGSEQQTHKFTCVLDIQIWFTETSNSIWTKQTSSYSSSSSMNHTTIQLVVEARSLNINPDITFSLNYPLRSLCPCYHCSYLISHYHHLSPDKRQCTPTYSPCLQSIFHLLDSDSSQIQKWSCNFLAKDFPPAFGEKRNQIL